jgi:RimJ/RimL family protein N-acetyltransferase
VTVRRLQPDDWELLRDIRLRSLRESPEAFSSSYEREAAFDETQWRSRADGVWFIATAGGAVVGVVAGFFDDTVPASERHLVAMWVAAQARGSGAAVDLVEAIVDWARDDGATEVSLGVFEDNSRARALYERCGFVECGELPATHVHVPGRQLLLYRRGVSHRVRPPAGPTAAA